MKTLRLFGMAMMAVLMSFTMASCGDDDDDILDGINDNINSNRIYDVLEINGENYACYGYRSPVTYTSGWDLDGNWTINLPCGYLSDAENEVYDFDFYYIIHFERNESLQEGSKLEDYSPVFEVWYNQMFEYTSGSATITDKEDDKYITIEFESFKFGSGSDSYTLNGTVQLLLDE